MIVRAAVVKTSTQNTAELKKFQNKTNNIWEYFKDHYEKTHENELVRLGAAKFAKDNTFRYYDSVLAYVTDQNGNKRFSGNILWSTDPKEDPVFYMQARELEKTDPQLLKYGRELAFMIQNQLIDVYYHNRIKKAGETVTRNGFEHTYTREDAVEDFAKFTSFRIGMLPLMPQSVGALLSQGKLKESLSKRYDQVVSTFVEFDDVAELTDNEKEVIDEMPDTFLRQFNKGMNESLGSLGLVHQRMTKLLRLAEHKDGYISLDDAKVDQNINTDLETLMYWFTLTNTRKINYENQVLPTINGAKFYLNSLHDTKNFNQKNALRVIDLFTNQAILGRREITNLKIGQLDMDALGRTAMAYANPLVMTVNFNVGVVSAIHNGFMAFIDGVSNDIANRWIGGEEELHLSSRHFAKASMLFFKDFHKVTQILKHFQLMNASETEMITHRFNQKRKKHIFSDFYAQITNWGTDLYARGVVTIAFMIKNGSYDAYTYDKETGEVTYNPLLDRKFYNENGSQTKEQKSRYDFLLTQLNNQGWGLDENNKPTMGFDHKELRSFKTYAEKYIVGSYGPIEKNLMGQFFVGRLFMMFSTWFSAKMALAFKKGTEIDDLGYYKFIEDKNGNLIPQWQREFTEGYLVTVYRMTYDLLVNRDVSQFRNMKPYEKRNWVRAVVTVATFAMARIMYNMLVAGTEEEDDPINESRLVRNWYFAGSSLLVLPHILEKVSSPFAVVGILNRAVTQGFDIGEGNFWNLRHVVPFLGAGYTISDFVQSFEN